MPTPQASARANLSVAERYKKGAKTRDPSLMLTWRTERAGERACMY